MFRYKHQYTESRSEAPADYTLPAVAAPGHNTTKETSDLSTPFKGLRYNYLLKLVLQLLLLPLKQMISY